MSRRKWWKMAMMSGGGAAGVYTTIPQFTYTPTLVDDFEVYNSWVKVTGSGVDAVDNAVNFSQGSHSMRITNVGAASSLDKAIAFTMGATDHIGLDVYYHGGGELSVDILFGNSAVSFVKYFYVNIRVSNAFLGWQHFDISPGDVIFDGGMTWTTPIANIRIRLNTTGGDASFDNFTHGPSTFSSAMIMSWDDQYPGLYNLGYPIFQARHLRSTMYVVSDHVDTPDHMTWAQLLEMYAAGWTIGNHTDDHVNFTALTDAQIQTSIGNCIADLQAAGIAGNGPYHMAYPGGIFNANSATAVVSQGILTARTVVGSTNMWYNPPPDYYLKAQNLDNTVSLATAKTRIDQAKARGKIVHFYGHDIAVSAAALTWAASDLAALLDYALSLGLPVITIDDYYNLYSQDVTVRIA